MVLDSVDSASQPSAQPELSTHPPRPVATHLYGQINISGNARVQLGDQYSNQEISSIVGQYDEQDGDGAQDSWLSLSVATATIKLSHFATRLAVGEELTNSETQRMPFQKNHLDAACLNLTRLRYELQSCMRYTVTKRGTDESSDFLEKVKLYPGDQIIKEAAVKCSGTAQSLIAAMAQIDMSQADGYQDARTALQSLESASVINVMLSELSNVCWQILLGMLMAVW